MAQHLNDITPVAPTRQALASLSITKATERWLVWLGYVTFPAERWSGKGRVKHDLFGFVDTLAICIANGNILAIQSTSKDEVRRRVKKILSHPNWPPVRKSPIETHVWGWKDGVLTDVPMDRQIPAAWGIDRMLEPLQPAPGNG